MLNVVIDLSHHNAQVDFAQAQRDGIMGVIHKATEGEAFVDPYYATREVVARHQGLWWGAYHFLTADDPVAQARHFLDVVKPTPGTLCAVDVEGAVEVAHAESFASTVATATGRWPVLYCDATHEKAYALAHSGMMTNCPLWVAEYGTMPAVHDGTWRVWTFWQYTDGRINAVPLDLVSGVGRCDRDRFNGDEDGLRRLWNR